MTGVTELSDFINELSDEEDEPHDASPRSNTADSAPGDGGWPPLLLTAAAAVATAAATGTGEAGIEFGAEPLTWPSALVQPTPMAVVQWNRRFGQLEAFKDANHGRLDPPSRSDLGRWLSRQVAACRAHRLPALRQRRLEILGVQIGVRRRKSAWATRYRELSEYFAQNGHSRVPAVYREQPALARWAREMRARKRQGKLSAQQIQDLTKLNFFND